MEMGADDYITKPFEEVELLSAIEVRLKKYDVLKTRYAIDKKGLSELMRDLNSSGLLKMKLDQYEGESMSKRAVLYQEGKRPRGLYYIRKGRVKAFRVSEDGKEYITNFYTDGDFFGFLSILEGANHDDSAEVLEEAEIVMIPREAFVNAVYYDIAIATKFIRMIAQDAKEKEERLLNLAYDSLRKRVARALVDIHVKFGHLDISREEIAQYAGMATESLVRTLHDFKNEALVEIKEGRIRILDVQQLKNFSY
jgi:CRP-like cAMP-binding protein